MDNYAAVTRTSLIENTETGCDLYLESHVNGVPKYVLFSRGDQIFCNERSKELKAKNIMKLFVKSTDFGAYRRYQENHLEKIMKREMPYCFDEELFIKFITFLGSFDSRRSQII